MRELDISTITGIIAAFISLLFAVFVCSVESKNKVSNWLFGAFLVLNALEYSDWFMHLFVNAPNNWLIVKTMLAYLPMPIFYLYILSVCYSDFRLKWGHLWHTAPYLIANLVMIPRFYLSNTSQKLSLFENYNDLYEIIFLQVSLHLQAIAYITAGFIVLRRAQRIFVENYSSNTLKAYKWLFQLLLFSAILYGAAMIKNVWKYYGEQDVFIALQLAILFIVLSITCWYVLKALRYPALFSGVDSKTELVNHLVEEKEQNIQYTTELKQLRNYMETEKPYLNPSLSIRNLAEELEMNPRDLSILINQRLNQHFFDFVNEYRIKEAMKILRNPTKNEETILEILYEVGFNSKSSFNTSFKKYTGKTPTEFRRST